MPQSFNAAERTPGLSLPLLFPGQAQKEFFVNHALTMLDTLVQASVIASLDAPPPAPIEGDAYRILSPASGEWGERSGSIALFIGGEWSFVSPTDGMRIYDRNAGQICFFRTQWITATTPAIPSGGDTVDEQARATLAEVVDILRVLGFLPQA